MRGTLQGELCGPMQHGIRELNSNQTGNPQRGQERTWQMVGRTACDGHVKPRSSKH